MNEQCATVKESEARKRRIQNMKPTHTPLSVAPCWTQYLRVQDFAAWLLKDDKNSACKEGDVY
jgi:hypothetical protein